MSVSFPYPHLVADVGGTNARFALVERPGAARTPMHAVATAHAETFEAACSDVIKAAGWPRPGSLLVAGGGPIIAGHLALTNAKWTLAPAAIAAATGAHVVVLLNDFEALSLAVPGLSGDALLRVAASREPAEPRSGPRVIVGPGTGLGVGALVTVAGRHHALSSEGGHATLMPSNATEQALWPFIQRVGGRVGAEVVLSGPGLVRLRLALGQLAGEAARAFAPRDITDAALGGLDRLSVDAVRVFIDLLARFCGDMALVLGASGGVFIGGGVMPRLATMIDHARFRECFTDKAPVAHYVEAISTSLIMAPDAALAGMADFAAHPERFWLDLGGRHCAR
jgi:glucokinase